MPVYLQRCDDRLLASAKRDAAALSAFSPIRSDSYDPERPSVLECGVFQARFSFAVLALSWALSALPPVSVVTLLIPQGSSVECRGGA